MEDAIGESIPYFHLYDKNYTILTQFLSKVVRITETLQVDGDEVYSISFFPDQREKIIFVSDKDDNEIVPYNPMIQQKVILVDLMTGTKTSYNSHDIIPRGFLPLRKFYKSSLVRDLSLLELYTYGSDKKYAVVHKYQIDLLKLIKYYNLMTDNMMDDDEVDEERYQYTYKEEFFTKFGRTLESIYSKLVEED